MPYARRQNLDDYPSEYDVATGGYNGNLRHSFEQVKADFGVAWIHHFHKRDGIFLHPDTRQWLEEQLGIVSK